MKIAILYHRDADGFGAAFAAWNALGGYKPDSGGGMGVVNAHDLLFHSVQYSEPIPYKELREFEPDQVYILDFSYKAPDLKILMEEFNVVVIDHHKSAAEELKDFPEITIIGDKPLPPRCIKEEQDLPIQLPIFSGVRIIQEQSGCMLAWAFFNPNEDAPELLHYVQDRDLWKFELEHSKAINAYIATMPLDFKEWSEFYMPLAYDAGTAILAFQARQIESRVKGVELVDFHMDDGFAFRRVAYSGSELGNWLVSPDASISPSDCSKFLVPVVNASDNISEVGEALCAAFPDAPFSMSYCDRPDGLRSYSLRSRNGFDVSEVARAFGGGGHAGAAGFSLPAPPKF